MWIQSYFLTGNLIRSLIQPTPWLVWHALMHNSLTHRSHSPSNHQEEFLLKNTHVKKPFRILYESQVYPFTQQNTTALLEKTRKKNKKNRKKEKKLLTHWKSNLIKFHLCATQSSKNIWAVFIPFTFTNIRPKRMSLNAHQIKINCYRPEMKVSWNNRR